MAGLVVATGFGFNFLARGIVDTFMVFMLPLEAEFGWTRATLTGVYSGYLLTVGLMSPVSGVLLDRWGPRLTYGSGLAVLALAMAGASISTGIWQVYLFNGVLCGIASSALGMVPTSALMGRWFDRRLSLAIAMAYAGFGSGILVLLPLVQTGIDAHGWRETYRLIAIGLAVLLPLTLLLPWTRIARGAGGVVNRAGHGTGAAGALPGWTLRSAARTPEFWLLVQCFFFTACAVYSVIVQTVVYLVDEGYPPIKAAFAFGTTGILSIVGVLSAGMLCGRYGYRFTATLSFAGTLTGAMALLAFAVFGAPALVFVYVLAFGITQGARGPVISTLAARIFARGAVGGIFGGIFMSMSFGAAVGAWVSGVLHDLTGDYRAAFVFSGLCVIAAVLPFWSSGRLLDPKPLAPPAARHDTA